MMALMQLLSVSCGLAREQTKQREGRKFHAGSSNRWTARPTEEKDGRESRRKATRSAAATPLPANGVSRTTSDPPSLIGAELPLRSYSYSALLLENTRKWVSTKRKTGASAQPGAPMEITFESSGLGHSTSLAPCAGKMENYFPFRSPATAEAPLPSKRCCFDPVEGS